MDLFSEYMTFKLLFGGSAHATKALVKQPSEHLLLGTVDDNSSTRASSADEATSRSVHIPIRERLRSTGSRMGRMGFSYSVREKSSTESLRRKDYHGMIQSRNGAKFQEKRRGSTPPALFRHFLNSNPSPNLASPSLSALDDESSLVVEENFRSFSTEGLYESPGRKVAFRLPNHEKGPGAPEPPAQSNRRIYSEISRGPINRSQSVTRRHWEVPSGDELDGSVSMPTTPRHKRSCSFRDVRRKRSWEKLPNGPPRKTVSENIQYPHSPLSGRKSCPGPGFEGNRRSTYGNLITKFRHSMKLRSPRSQTSNSYNLSTESLNSNRSGPEDQDAPGSTESDGPNTQIMISNPDIVSLLIGICFKADEETLTVSIEKIKIHGHDFQDFYIALLHYQNLSLIETSTTEVMHAGETEYSSFYTCVEEVFVLPTKFRHLKDTAVVIEVWKKRGKDSVEEFPAGRILISQDSSEESRAQWSQFLHTIGYPATMWHTLSHNVEIFT